MPAFSGSYTGRAQSQAIVNVPDVAGHVLDLFMLQSVQKCTDKLWNGASIVMCATSDLAGGRGRQSGYFTNIRSGNDRNHGTFKGTVKSKGDQVIVEGTWKLTGGTG